jgi:integrase
MVHNYHQRLKYWLTRVDTLKDNDKEIANRFVDALLIAGVGEAKVFNYAQFSYEILKIKSNLKIEKSIKDFSREEVDRIAKVIINDKGWSYSTISIALRALKRLIHYAKHRKIADGNNTKYCYEVEHIHPDRYKRKAMKVERIKASELLTEEELLRMIDKVPLVSRYPKRDKAMLYVMYEFAARPSELLNMKVGGVVFEENCVTITTIGKTGVKTLSLVLSYQSLREWLEEHPDKDNPEAWLWYSKPKGRISYGRLRKFIKEVAKAANIKKKVWLYLFRHTALTHVEKEFGSSITEQYGNWRKGSPMRNVYTHLANSDQKEVILKKHGIKKDISNGMVTFRECYRCNTKNEPNAIICKLCGLILDKEYANTIRNNQQEKIKELEEKIERLTMLFDELTKRIS